MSRDYEVSVHCDMDDMDDPTDAVSAFMAWIREDATPAVRVLDKNTGERWTVEADTGRILRGES